MSRKCADGVHKVCASSAQSVQAISTNCAHAVALLNPPSTDKRIFFRNKSFYTTFQCNFFVKKTAFTATTATYCHPRNPLNKGKVAEWQ